MIRSALLLCLLSPLPLLAGNLEPATTTAPAAAPALPTGEELTKIIEEQDRQIFAAFNTCDLDAFGPHFSEGLEFYHDKGGLAVGRQASVDALRDNICGKVRREPVEGTSRVYPMDGYGALHTGWHRFCDFGGDTCNGKAQFAHLYRYVDGRWVIERVISYDHQPL